MAKVWRQIDLLLDVPDGALEDARPVIRSFVKTGLEQHGGVVPNEFVDNTDQAADHAAQDDNMAVSALITLAIHDGLARFAPSITRQDTVTRPLPADYTPPPVS